MIVAITGARGFIGKAVVQAACRANHQLRILTRQQDVPSELLSAGVQVVRGGAEKLDALLEGADWALNLAGEIRDPAKMHAANVALPLQALEAARRAGVRRVVHLSSAGVVGSAARGNVDESSALCPANEYERSKLEGEQAFLNAPARQGMVRVALRPTIVFGPGRPFQQDSFCQLLKAIQSGRYVRIAGGRGIYNLCFVEDLADALLAAARADLPDGSRFFLNDPITFLELERIVRDVAGLTRQPRRLPAAAAMLLGLAGDVMRRVGLRFPFTSSRYRVMVNRTVFSDQLFREASGWKPAHGTAAGIRLTAQWLIGGPEGQAV